MKLENNRMVMERSLWRQGIFLIAGLLLLGWILSTPPGILGKADAVGYAVCHRIDSRSFQLGNHQFPLCVRCSGQYLGALFGMVYLGFLAGHRSGTPRRSVLLILFLFVLAYAIDGLNSYFHLPPMLEMFPSFPRLYQPKNEIRFVTGSGMGFSISVAILVTFNRTIWSKREREPVIRNLKQLISALFLLAVLNLLVLTENPVILYPLAILSAASVVLLLSVVYSLVVTMIFHMENNFSRFSQLRIPLTAGFILAILQLAVFDALRLLLTGTWEGFQL